MTLYFKLKIKDMLSNAELLGWGIGFIEFWVLMWVFVFSRTGEVKGSWEEIVVHIDASMAFSFLGLLSMASVAISLAYYVFYASRAARYITKFTRISPMRFMIEDFMSSLVVILIIVAVIYFSVMAVSHVKWGILPIPENPVGVFVDLIIGGVYLYWLSYMLALTIIVTRRTRALTMASFIPLILAFIAYSQLWIDFGNAMYIIPLCPLPALIMYHATGAIPPTGSYLFWLAGSEMFNAVNLRLAALSTFAWIIVFALASLILLRKSRGIPIEELRV